MCFYCDREVKGNPQFWWYKNYVCWTCRVQNGVTKQKEEGGRICFRCNQPMVNVGFKFKTPKKSDIKSWKDLQKTWQVQQKFVDGVETYVGPKERIVDPSF